MKMLALILVIAVAVPAGARSLEAARPARDFRSVAPPPADPLVTRQGGDTWEEAVPIPALPYLTTGTTVGYTANCCWEMCPHEAYGPAVFYGYTPAADVVVRVDLCGSNYDTGLYVYDESLFLVACNVDHYFGPPCGMYVSCIERAVLTAGQFYYIVVTGFGGDSGDYVLEVTEFEECVVPGQLCFRDRAVRGSYRAPAS